MISLDEKSKEIIEDILSAYIEKNSLLVFGSRLSGKCEDYSDLDLVVRSENPIPFSEYLALKDELEFSELPMRVDLLDWQRISPEFREIIEENCETWH